MGAREVVVTGLGMTTPLGGDVVSTWEAMLRGDSGVVALHDEWAAELPVRIAARVADDPTRHFDRVLARRLDRSEQLALIAARQAWSDAGLSTVDNAGEPGPGQAARASALTQVDSAEGPQPGQAVAPASARQPASAPAHVDSAEESQLGQAVPPASAGQPVSVPAHGGAAVPVATGSGTAAGPMPSGAVDPERLAVVVGTGIGGVTTLFAQHDVRGAKGARFMSPHTLPMIMPNGPAGWVGLEFGAKAGVRTVASACATGAEAIAVGLELIRTGKADVVIAGGTEAVIHPSTLGAFAAMRALSQRNDEPARASRPFDKGRDGFVLGEGAGILVLESAEHAAARGARVYAKVAGAAVTSDSHHMVAPDPTGAGAARAISLALADADMDRRDVAHVSAHATATPLGDLAELAALRATIGDHAAIFAPKSMLGHLIGAAGAVESIAAILAIVHGVVPPSLNLDDPDDTLALDLVTVHPRRMRVPVAVKNSFGFGGHNVALVFTA